MRGVERTDGMKRQWTVDEVAEHWTLYPADEALLVNKAAATRLGCALLLKYFQIEGRFPPHKGDVPAAAIVHVAQQLDVPPELYAQYDGGGRTIEFHRAQIRQALGFREATVQDADALAAWLGHDVLPHEHRPEQLQAAIYARCRAGHFVDSHGQSEIAFAFTRLLGFQLMPRLKGIHAQKLYRPVPGQKDAYPHLQPVLSRTINWDVIRQQYDEMVKFATALRLGTAETEAILRRFTRSSVQHPTYAALAELGKVVKTIFLCSYLRDPAVRREVHEGLQVVENWNSANNFIHYGKGGEIATNRLDDQEVSVLCMTLVQNALCLINTLMIQRVLAEPAWMERMAAEDLRGLTPLIYAHVNPYGVFRLDMDERLALEEMEAVG